jgi:fructokinase
LETEYLALGIVSWTCTLSPQRLVLGGGVMQRAELFPKLRVRVAELLNGYLEPPEIVPPQLGTRAGVLGAIALASKIARPR